MVRSRRSELYRRRRSRSGVIAIARVGGKDASQCVTMCHNVVALVADTGGENADPSLFHSTAITFFEVFAGIHRL